MDVPERDCAGFEELASAALDGEATPAEREALDAHLVRCDGCREEAERFRRLDRALAADAPAGPPALAARVDAIVRPAPVVPERRRRFAPLAAAAALLVVAGALLDSGDRTEAVAGDLPLREIAELQRRSLDDQALLMETMRWELRALRLEVRALGEPDDAPVLERIDRLLTHAAAAPWPSPSTRSRAPRAATAPPRPRDPIGDDR